MTRPDATAAQYAEFYRGFAAALATLIRDFDQPTMAKNIMTSNGVTVRDLQRSKVEPFDLTPIRKAMR